ncbi:hypothetical protein NE235_36075 [Actinoallomurus spadix]|uniref:hypothetical protein n=1 Tax=Actinoallomurus spadix TaxID=79912 RepID=UPI00209240E9|nr:hypothetical protein [Actinoallomurus spadix]MCO5991547.1 hypothetical protein [Actinoallomurus spadix]
MVTEGVAPAEPRETLIIRGTYDNDAFTLFFEGAWRTPGEVARWIAKNTTYEPGDPLLLLVPGIGRPRPDGGLSFADEIVARLGGPALSPETENVADDRWIVHWPGTTGSAPSEAPETAPEPVPVSVPAVPAQAVPAQAGTERRDGGERPPAVQQAPWYVETDALGEAAFTGVDPWSADQVEFWADRVGGGTRHEDDGAELTAAIRQGLRDLLRTDDPEEWRVHFQKGHLVTADGRLVWLRPVLRGVTVGTQPSGGVREFAVSFASLSAGGKTAREVFTGLDGMLLSFLALGTAVASVFIPGLPMIGAGSAHTREAERERQLIAGRKLYVAENTRFRGGMAVRVFVDGVERPNDVVLPARFDLDLPEPFTAAGAPRPDRTAPETGEERPGQRPHQATEVINAVDTIPAVTALQRRMLGAGMPAESVRQVMTEVLEHLTESSARNRSRLLLSSGIPTKQLRVKMAKGSFKGHFAIKARITSLQYLGDSDVAVRFDTGAGLSVKPGRLADSRAFTGFDLSFAGLAAPGHEGDGEKGFIHGPTFVFDFSRGTGYGATEQALGHTVLNTTGPQSRYRSGLELTVEIRSTTHDLPPVSAVVESEVSVARRDAADFEERLTGAVRTPELRPRPPQEETGTPPAARDGAGQETASPARPNVAVLQPPPGGLPPRSAYVRPKRLGRAMKVDPSHREPLALAARKGFGFGMGVTLPGSELVHDQLRAVLAKVHHDALPERQRKRKTDWSNVDLDLAAWFSRPALESSPPALLAGIEHTVTLGGRKYALGAKAHLMERLNRDGVYKMTVNGRALMGASAAGHRKTEFGVKAAFGAGLRVRALDWLRVAIGAAAGRAEYAYTRKFDLSGGAKSYRRTETTENVDEHNYNVIYELWVRPVGGRAEIWWIDQRNDVTARVVVPHEHRPAVPLTIEEIRAAGQATRIQDRPQEPEADFGAGGSSGLYPSFFAMPELPRLAAGMYAEANGLPGSWLADEAGWPLELKELAQPDKLAEYFPALAGRSGRFVALPKGADGMKQALRIRLRGYRPRHVNADGGTEIEQYVQGTAQQKTASAHKGAAGGTFSAGPQFRLGAEARPPHSLSPEEGLFGDAVPGGDAVTDTHGASSGTVHAASGAGGQDSAVEKEHPWGGRIQVTGHGGATWERKREKGRDLGSIAISRATYGGTTHTYRMDPVFEVTLFRRKGSRRTMVTRYLRVTDAMDLLVPERRIFDLGLTAPGVTPPVPRPPTHHVPPALLKGMSYPETLDGDQVLDRIKERLRGRGLLRAFFDGEERPNLLWRLIESAYSSDALRNQYNGALTGSGVVRWVPVPLPFGGTRYLWIRVRARTGAATEQLDRPEVKLTLRDETLAESIESEGFSRGWEAGVQVRARVGREGHGQGHGGPEFGGGYERKSGHGSEETAKTLEIHRAGTQEGSLESRNPLDFKVELGLSAEPPEILDVPLRLVKAGVVGLGRLAQARELGDAWYGNRPFIWYHVDEPGPDGVKGDVRLLVPRSIAVLDAPGEPIAPVVGTDPQWVERGPWQGRDPEAVHALIDNLHPWDAAFAATVERWAGPVASPYGRPRDLEAPGAWRIPGVDFTTKAGLRYAHFTGEDMLRANIRQVLGNAYRVPVLEREAVVGVEITRAEVIGPVDGIRFKGRNYTQESKAGKEKQESSRGWHLGFGPEGGGEAGSEEMLGAGLGEYGRERSEEQSGELGVTEERNKEATRHYRHYRFDVDVYLTGRHGVIRVHAPGGLHGMLPLEEDPAGGRRLADGLETRLPHLFGPKPQPPEPIRGTSLRRRWYEPKRIRAFFHQEIENLKHRFAVPATLGDRMPVTSDTDTPAATKRWYKAPALRRFAREYLSSLRRRATAQESRPDEVVTGLTSSPPVLPDLPAGLGDSELEWPGGRTDALTGAPAGESAGHETPADHDASDVTDTRARTHPVTGERAAEPAHTSPHEQPAPPVTALPAATEGGPGSAADAGGVDGSGLTRPQAAALERMGLRPVLVLATGDPVVHALQAVAPAETSVAAGGRPASPAELRAYLADALATDLNSGAPRFWPAVRMPDGATDDQRRALIAALTSPQGGADADEAFLAAAAAVLGLRVAVLRPDGGTVESGSPSGRPVVLLRLQAPGRYTAAWAGTEPDTDGGTPATPPARPAPRPPVRPAPPTGDLGAVPPPARNAASAEAAARTPIANLDADPFQGSAGGGTVRRPARAAQTGDDPAHTAGGTAPGAALDGPSHGPGRSPDTARRADSPAERLERRLTAMLPEWDGTAQDCVPRLAAVWQGLYGRPVVAGDDATVGSMRPETDLAAALGGDWRPLGGRPEDLVPVVEAVGAGAMAFILVSSPNGPGHGFALRNEGGSLFWLETQARAGERVRAVGARTPVTEGDVRVIVTDPAGRAVPLDLRPEAGDLVDTLTLARTDGTYGMKGHEPAAGRTGQKDASEAASEQAVRSGGEPSAIAEEFGIQVDSGTAVTAVKESNPRARAEVLAKVRERRWAPEEMSALHAALKHYAPILGKQRERSSRAGIAQEVTHIGAVSFGISNREIDFGMAGQYIESHQAVNLYAPILFKKDLGGGRREIEGTITHELAHGLLGYALPEFTEAFGSWGPDGRPKLPGGVEPPYSGAKTAAEDLEASIRASLLVPDTLAAESPKHAAAIAELRQRHPELFETGPKELAWRAAKRIAGALKDQLPEFARMVGSWTEDGWPNFAGERPITRYGATDAGEDLSETAKYYFLEPDTLRAKAPQRAAFFDRLIAEWAVSEPESPRPGDEDAAGALGDVAASGTDPAHSTPYPADDDRFYHGLLALAGPHLTREIPELTNIPPGGREAAQVVRNWLADRLEADVAVASQGLLSRYARFFHGSGDETSFADWGRAMTGRIRGMDGRHEETDDLVAHLLAKELGLPLTLVRDGDVTRLGPAGSARIRVDRTPDGLEVAENTHEAAQKIRWELLRPAPPTPADRSARQFEVVRGALERRLQHGEADYRNLRERIDPDARTAIDARTRAMTDRFWGARMAGGLADVPAHRRAPARLDAMRGAVADLEALIRNLHEQLGDRSEPPAPGVRADTPVSEELVSEVNLQLTRLGAAWLGGRVGRGEVEQALRDIPPQGPTDPRGLATDLAHQIAFDEVTRVPGGGQGSEHERPIIIHVHRGEPFGGERELLVYNRRTGVGVWTDTGGIYMAGGRYLASEESAEASRLGRVTEVDVTIPELVTSVTRTLPGEGNHFDPEVADAGLRDTERRLNNAPRLRDGESGREARGMTPRELFGDDPDHEFGPRADDVTILRPPGFIRRAPMHLTEGVPVPFVAAFLAETKRFISMSDVRQWFRAGSRFGADVTREYFNGWLGLRVGRFAVPAMEYVPSVAEVRTAATLLNTHTYAVADVFANDAELAKNLVHGTLRTSFAGIREKLQADVQEFLENNRDWIRDRLETDLRERLGSAIRRYEQRARENDEEPLDLFDYTMNDDTMTLGDYADNMLLPPSRVRSIVNQYDAMNVRTHFAGTDDNEGALAFDLAVLELRDVVPEGRSLGREMRTARTFADIARRFYAWAERVDANNGTDEGRAFNENLVEAVRAISAHNPSGGDLVTSVRDLLDSVAWRAPDVVREPIFRGHVTSNLQADAVVALHDLLRYADAEAARAVRRAVSAIRTALVYERNAASWRVGRRNLDHVRLSADQVIEELLAYETSALRPAPGVHER